MQKKIVALSLFGTQLDLQGRRRQRWQKWRPNVSLCYQANLPIAELHLLHSGQYARAATKLSYDINEIAPHTHIELHTLDFADPWDFGEVYGKLYDWCQHYPFDPEQNDYLFHISTGTHVAQICAFLLTESRHFPGRLVQTAPDAEQENKAIGKVQIIDLDLARYDLLAQRFDNEHREGSEFLKGGIATRNPAFNELIAQIEKVAIRSAEPILLTGPTGAGKSQLAERIYQLKKRRAQVSGAFVAVNCATLKGMNAMAALFGHTRGAFTGALQAREGFLRHADNGILFLDEIGELGLEEQAMLLHAIESKTFYPVGSEQRVHSDFQIIAGTNRDLLAAIREGTFREDLLARINLWTYALPALAERREDIPVNVEYELQRFEQRHARRVRFNKEAWQHYMAFAAAPTATWSGNFRDLSASVTRLCTLADSSRITTDDVRAEQQRLLAQWQPARQSPQQLDLEDYLTPQQIAAMDDFDRHQLRYVLTLCRQSPSLAAAGRALFNVSRLQKQSVNDSSRLQKYLQRFGLKWRDIHPA